MIKLLRFRGGTKGRVSPNTVGRDDELAIDTDTGEIKVCDGVTTFASLPAINAGAVGNIDGGAP